MYAGAVSSSYSYTVSNGSYYIIGRGNNPRLLTSDNKIVINLKDSITDDGKFITINMYKDVFNMPDIN